MIIKKKYAESIASPPVKKGLPRRRRGNPLSEGDFIDDSEEQISELFEPGKSMERRRTDRRGGFRRDEDRQVISRAEEEAIAIRERAAQEGFEAGLQQAEEIITHLNESMASFLSAREDALGSVADELAAMAVEIAERIIKTEVSCDENLVMSIVRHTIAKAGQEQKSILIKVNPLDLKLVKETMQHDSQLSKAVEVLVAEDRDVDAGSCLIETRAGQIDARFSTQLEILKKMIATGGKF